MHLNETLLIQFHIIDTAQSISYKAIDGIKFNDCSYHSLEWRLNDVSSLKKLSTGTKTAIGRDFVLKNLKILFSW